MIDLSSDLIYFCFVSVLGGFDTAHAAARLNFDSNLKISCVVVYEFVGGYNCIVFNDV